MLKIHLHDCLPPFPHTGNPTTITTTEAKTDLPKVLSTAIMGQLDVFRHYWLQLGMYSAQVGVLEDAGQIIISGLL